MSNIFVELIYSFEIWFWDKFEVAEQETEIKLKGIMNNPLRKIILNIFFIFAP
ncbi:hypothetical protein NPA11_02805 [Mycoplasma sp. 1578d]|uniref:hypothetical protein n=1 Tax=Mycoplasma sp. 1578d TaxID=2967299 RepID=UPI00211B9AF0|nr:hypothetical protein [Mycoplasma sp. 1578d]UUM19675.1 hypothetical protein NPA11_02805 [Mycoplasma sp. 1578d]